MKKVYVDMVGDLFHKGHVELLKAARAFGDYLLVGDRTMWHLPTNGAP